MTFADIPQNVAVFVDANTFVYHFSLHPVFAPACTQLLDHIARQEYLGFTSADVLSDVAHRLMAFEASVVLGWTGPGLTQRLRRHPDEIQKLSGFRQAVQKSLLLAFKYCRSLLRSSKQRQRLASELDCSAATL